MSSISLQWDTASYWKVGSCFILFLSYCKFLAFLVAVASVYRNIVVTLSGCPAMYVCGTADIKVHEAYMGHIWGRQDPGGPHVGPMNLVIRDTKELSSKAWKACVACIR